MKTSIEKRKRAAALREAKLDARAREAREARAQRIDWPRLPWILVREPERRCVACLLRVGFGEMKAERHVGFYRGVGRITRRLFGIPKQKIKHTHIRTIAEGTAGDPNARQRKRKSEKRARLSDSYIKSKITSRTNLKFSDIPPEMVALYRAKIELLREIKKHKNTNEKHERHQGDAV
jgi:hypothetical protein